MVLPVWHSDRHSGRQRNAPVLQRRPPVSDAGRDALLIVTNVAGNGAIIFRRNDDYELFLKILDHHLKNHVRLVACLLTPVSYELLLCQVGKEHRRACRRPPQSHLRTVMAAALTHYARAFNRRYHQRGKLFSRGFRLMGVYLEEDKQQAITGMANAAKALDDAFHIPVWHRGEDC